MYWVIIFTLSGQLVNWRFYEMHVRRY